MSQDRRIHEHPVLPVEAGETVTFYWNGQPLTGKKGEALSSALIAADVSAFGRNAHDHAPQGIFCANGQCSKCLVIVDGRPVKSCMTPVAAGMKVNAADELPALPDADAGQAAGVRPLPEIAHRRADHRRRAGGACRPRSSSGAWASPPCSSTTRHEPGGKLVLQTHKFFGSVEDSQAGTRGMRIGRQLAAAVAADPHVTVWPDSTVLYVYSDRKVGVLRNGAYQLVVPKVVLNAAGAREKSLVFPGNHLIGVYGAGAFQTLVNRDLVRPAEPPVHRRRRQRRPDRRLPRPAGRHHGGRPGRSAARLRRLQGPCRQAEAPGRADLHRRTPFCRPTATNASSR